MGKRTWTIESLNDDQLFCVQAALHGGQFHTTIFPPIYIDTPQIARQILSMQRDSHLKLMAACENVMELKSEWKRAPNLDDVRSMRVTYVDKEPYGPFGLLKKSVTKEKTVPNPDFQKIERYLQKDSFILVRSERAEEEGANYDVEYDDAILLTSSGRFVRASYSVTYFPQYGTKIYGASEVDQLDEKVNILTAALISRYMGKETFDKLYAKFSG